MRILVFLLCLLSCQQSATAELSLLDGSSFVQLFTSPHCGVHTVRSDKVAVVTRKEDDPNVSPSDDLPTTSSSSNPTGAFGDCAWRRVRFEFRAHDESLATNSSVDLLSGEFVSLDTPSFSAPPPDNRTNLRVAFHISITPDGLLNANVSRTFFHALSSDDRPHVSSLPNRFSFRSINRLQVLFRDYGLKVLLKHTPHAANSTFVTSHHLQWIEIRPAYPSLWRFSRQLRIGQTVNSARFNQNHDSSNQTTSVRSHRLCLSNLHLNGQKLPLRPRIAAHRSAWSDQLEPPYSPYRVRTFGPVASGCGVALGRSCQPPCLHGALCRADLDGSGFCDCEGVGYAGTDCYFRK